MRKQTTILLGGLLAVGIVAVLVAIWPKPRAADAAPMFETETLFYQFYQDGKFKNKVGHRIVTCNSGVYREGEFGPFVKTLRGENCNSGGGQYCVYCFDRTTGERVNPCPWTAEFQGYPNCS